MNNHSDNRQLREKWERWTRTPADLIRNDRTGVTHLAVSHQDYTLCGISGLRRIRRHGLLILIQRGVFACVFTVLHRIAEARQFGHTAVAQRYAGLRTFAAKISQTVEIDREKFRVASHLVVISVGQLQRVTASADCK
jgi:hypothetical protein